MKLIQVKFMAGSRPTNMGILNLIFDYGKNISLFRDKYKSRTLHKSKSDENQQLQSLEQLSLQQVG